MDFEKLTYKSKDVIEAVVNLAVANKNQYITPLHLLNVLLNGKNELILNLIAQAGGDIVQIRDKMDKAFAKMPIVGGSAVQTLMSQDFTALMMEAEKSQNLQPGNKRNRKVNGVVPVQSQEAPEKKETKEKPNLKTTKDLEPALLFYLILLIG